MEVKPQRRAHVSSRCAWAPPVAQVYTTNRIRPARVTESWTQLAQGRSRAAAPSGQLVALCVGSAPCQAYTHNRARPARDIDVWAAGSTYLKHGMRGGGGPERATQRQTMMLQIYNALRSVDLRIRCCGNVGMRRTNQKVRAAIRPESQAPTCILAPHLSGGQLPRKPTNQW